MILKLLTVAALVVIGFMLLALVIAFGGPYTGPLEKLALVPVATLLVWAAIRLSLVRPRRARPR